MRDTYKNHPLGSSEEPPLGILRVNYVNVTGNRFQKFVVIYLMSENLWEFKFCPYFVYVTFYVPSYE